MRSYWLWFCCQRVALAQPVAPTTNLVVVIDAGHGGFDGGAGNRQLKLVESQLNLQLAKTVKAVLEESSAGRMTAFLTRTQDQYLALSDRVIMANQWQADIFISLHCNASNNVQASGFEVFHCSRAASSRSAELLAQRENAGAITDPYFSTGYLSVESVLTNLIRQRHLTQSRRYAQLLLTEFTSSKSTHVTKAQVRGVKSANFLVLRRAEMPAVLVEAGFISNNNEARRLQQPIYQRQLAESIYRSLILWQSISNF